MRSHWLWPVLLLAISSCGETPSETTARLAEMIAAGQQDEAIQEINELLIENNRESSTPLNDEATSRVLKRSLDGSIAAWTQEDEFHFHTPDEHNQVEFDGQSLRDFTLSYTGRFAIVLAEADAACRPYAVSLEDDQILDQELALASCYEAPAITDDGAYYYYPEKGGIRVAELDPGNETQNDATASGARPEDLPASEFKAKFKKITNQFTLIPVNQRGLLIFYGAAGAYDLYYYSGQGKKVTKIEAPGKNEQFARPGLYSVFEGDSSDTTAEGEDTPLRNQENLPDYGAYGLDTAQAFVYAGGAGKRKLYGLRFSEPPKLERGVPARVTEHLVFLRDRKEFLILKKDHMSYWDPLRNTRSALPLVARGFVMYSGGLIYIDLLNRVYLREKPFSHFELELMRLRESASPDKE